MRTLTQAALVTALAAAPIGSAPAGAEPVDLSRLTCAEFLDSGTTERTQIALWLHGFYAGAAQRPSLDLELLQRGLSEMERACGRRTSLPLLGAETRALLNGDLNADAVVPPPAPPAAPAPASRRASPMPSGSMPSAKPQPLR